MNDKTIEILNQTDVEVLHQRLPNSSRRYQEVQQMQSVQAASARWRLLAEVRHDRRREGGR